MVGGRRSGRGSARWAVGTARSVRGAWIAAGLAVALGCLSLAGCGGPAARAIRFDDARVEVHAAVEPLLDGQMVVVAQFRPTESNVHLYGQELPDGGIDGAGRPTRLVVDDPAWRTVGATTSSVASRPVSLAGFDTPFATYPDGPVTLRQVIEPTGVPATDGTVQVKVTFMACSSAGLCYKPVEGEVVDLPLE